LGQLALRPVGVRRETLLSILWPDREAALAGQSLNTLVYSARESLGDEIGGASPVLQSCGYYRLNLEAGIAVDLARFESLTEEGHRLVSADDPEGASRAYRQALACYCGDLALDGDVSTLIERERLRCLCLTVLAYLADQRFRVADYAGAQDYALRLLSHDPCREDAHRLVMRCHVRRGERAQALRQYRLCEEILGSYFQAPPEPATKVLFDQVRLDPSAI